eukprot:TRINITY_DN6541_c0_g1_i1.p1 TRINITY_DN6541_c0_g1~~TRINITY_DN6541_c0_g1_i1.p1  ORF type:complete len:309 (+),score=115.15 TRINITY_DN6541_c0_g1_i1:89-1015(+)
MLNWFNLSSNNNNNTQEKKAEEKIDNKKEEDNKNQEKGKLISFFSSIGDTIKEKINQTTQIINTKQNESKKEEGQLAYPWSFPDDPKKEEIILNQAKLLSHEIYNFMNTPSPTLLENFEFDMEKYTPIAIKALEYDQRLGKIRFYLVPNKIKEDKFWYNYFARMHILRDTISKLDISTLNELPHKNQKLIDNKEDIPNFNTKEMEELQSEMSKLLGGNQDSNDNDTSTNNLNNNLQFDENELENQINNVLNDESLSNFDLGLVDGNIDESILNDFDLDEFGADNNIDIKVDTNIDVNDLVNESNNENK